MGDLALVQHHSLKGVHIRGVNLLDRGALVDSHRFEDQIDRGVELLPLLLGLLFRRLASNVDRCLVDSSSLLDRFPVLPDQLAQLPGVFGLGQDSLVAEFHLNAHRLPSTIAKLEMVVDSVERRLAIHRGGLGVLLQFRHLLMDSRDGCVNSLLLLLKIASRGVRPINQ